MKLLYFLLFEALYPKFKHLLNILHITLKFKIFNNFRQALRSCQIWSTHFFMGQQAWSLKSYWRFLQESFIVATSWRRTRSLTHHISISFSKWGISGSGQGKTPRDSPSLKGLDATVWVHTQERLLITPVYCEKVRITQGETCKDSEWELLANWV